jgi:hypothetical protein
VLTRYKRTRQNPAKIQQIGAFELGRFGPSRTAFSHRRGIGRSFAFWITRVTAAHPLLGLPMKIGYEKTIDRENFGPGEFKIVIENEHTCTCQKALK